MKLKKDLEREYNVIYVCHSSTDMRFLIAYYTIQEGRINVLKGSQRMHQRPIAPLVEALQSMGAEVKYIDKQGYPPLEIRGKKLQVESVEVDTSMSSQYVSALLLIGSVLPDGLQIKLREIGR